MCPATHSMIAGNSWLGQAILANMRVLVALLSVNNLAGSLKRPPRSSRGKAAAAAGIRHRAPTFGYSPAEREGTDACADYLTAKKGTVNSTV